MSAAAATDAFFSSRSILSSSSDAHGRSKSRQYSSSTKKQERQSLPRNQVFGGTAVDSFLLSSTSNIAQSSIGISRQYAPKILSPSASKRYVSSFKTLVNSTNGKHTQRVSYVNDSVIIVKLSKDADATESTIDGSQMSSKYSSLSMVTTTAIGSSPGLNPILKVERQKRRTTHHDSVTTPVNTDSTVPNSAHNMAMSTTSQPSSNPSLFVYRSSVTGGNASIRQKAIAETTSNNLLITTERFKSNISTSMRPSRQPLTVTTPIMPSAYTSTQQPQRNVNQNPKTRVQQDKLTNLKDFNDYPDPFTNCPQDVLSKLAQLTKLQLETVDWEKKRRFTKKKPIASGTSQGKDSP